MIAVGLRTTSVILGKTRAALYRVCRSTTSCHRPLPDLLDVVHRHTLLPVIPQTKQGSSVGGGTARVNPRHAGQDEGSEDACCGVVDCRGKRRYGPAHGRAERSIPCSPAPARFEGLRRVGHAGRRRPRSARRAGSASKAARSAGDADGLAWFRPVQACGDDVVRRHAGHPRSCRTGRSRKLWSRKRLEGSNPSPSAGSRGLGGRLVSDSRTLALRFLARPRHAPWGAPVDGDGCEPERASRPGSYRAAEDVGRRSATICSPPAT